MPLKILPSSSARIACIATPESGFYEFYHLRGQGERARLWIKTLEMQILCSTTDYDLRVLGPPHALLLRNDEVDVVPLLVFSQRDGECSRTALYAGVV